MKPNRFGQIPGCDEWGEYLRATPESVTYAVCRYEGVQRRMWNISARADEIRQEIDSLSGKIGDAVVRRYGRASDIGDGRDMRRVAPGSRQKREELQRELDRLYSRSGVLLRLLVRLRGQFTAELAQAGLWPPKNITEGS